MFWITENHFLFVGLFDWGNAETFSVSWNRDGFALAESRTRKSSTVAPLQFRVVLLNCLEFSILGSMISIFQASEHRSR